ncbi:MAG: hypothetical protein K6E19_05150 [Lachnospiraceae bacterium]|nr:hypothetical protein [Lachnospiraceae bacterium]
MNKRKEFIITGLIISLSTALLAPLTSVLLGNTRAVIIRNSVISMFFSLIMLFAFLYSYNSGRLDYDNADHPYRFMLVYLVSLALALGLPVIDRKGWPFMCLCVALSLFSNTLIGIYCSTGLLAISLMLTDSADVTTFIVYFLTCLVACILFQNIEDNFKIGSCISISVMTMLALETAGFIVPENKALSAEQFIIPLVNVIVNILVLFLCLKYFNEKVANKYRNKYSELNDQGYKVLLDLKERSPSEYYRSIHTAYLTERMATAIGCDVDVAKNCAYYHRIRKAFGYSLEDCRKFVSEHEFPPAAAKTLLEFLNKDNKLDSKEAGIVYISDKFISSIQLVFSKDKTAKINYGELLDTIIGKDYIKKSLVDSDLSIKDCRLIKEVILKETLYYDFLR